MSSLRVALATKMTKEDNDRLRLQELEALDEKRLQAQQRIKLYQTRISKAFNKKVKERVLQKGDLVLAVSRLMVMTHKTKGKFLTKMGRTVRNRNSLLKWGLSPSNSKRRHNHSVD